MSYPNGPVPRTQTGVLPQTFATVMAVKISLHLVTFCLTVAQICLATVAHGQESPNCQCHHDGLFVLPQRVAIADGVVTTRETDAKAHRFVPGKQLPKQWKPKEAEHRWIYLVLHHSATTSGSVESIHREHQQRKDRYGNNWLGIGYHFVIGNGSGMPDGEIMPTFRWNHQIHGAHSGSSLHNSKGIGICLIGNFEEAPPTKKQLTALNQLLSSLAARYQIPNSQIIGHNAVRATACPGKHFPFSAILRHLDSQI